MTESNYESLLNRVVARYVYSTTKNEFGEDIETWTYNASGIKCRLVPVSAEELHLLPGNFQNVRYTGYFLSSQALTVNDELKYNGETYRVNSVEDDSSGYVRKALLSIK